MEARDERACTLITRNLPFDEWTSVFHSERLKAALLDRLTQHVHILEMNGYSYPHAATRQNGNPASILPSNQRGRPK